MKKNQNGKYIQMSNLYKFIGHSLRQTFQSKLKFLFTLALALTLKNKFNLSLFGL